MTSVYFEQVYQTVRHIPPGKVATYGQIARLLGNPRAARTVGWALHSLPSGSDVPWQRVINARGTISLDARRPGGAIQRVLLEAEGVAFDDEGHIDLETYGWTGLDLAERDQILQLAREP
ncbi:MAG: MGMT family protein [Anaerolineae bacterium]|jgi:methylated-DNA-protein-cysteine methyltransferase-like protein